MALEHSEVGLARQLVLAEITSMVLTVTGEDPQWAARVTADSRLEADLRFDSLELAALGELLATAYGSQADLPAYVASLDIDELIGLTVGDIADYVRGRVPASGLAGIDG